MPGPSTKHLAAGDAIVRTQAQPGGKVVLVLPTRHIQADLADHGLGDPDVDAIDPGQVDAADAVQFTTQIKLRSMAARLPAPLEASASRLSSGRLGLRA